MGEFCGVARFVVLICSFQLVTSMLWAQTPADWQPVPKEDLALMDNPAKPGSSAMILDRQVYSDDEKRFQTELVRIKVLTEEGRAYADVEIPYLAKNITVSDIRGRTVHADGTVINFDGTVFDNVVVKYKKYRYEQKTFTLPAVEVGSVIEYAYTVHWKEAVPDIFRNPFMYFIEGGFAYPTAIWTAQMGLFTRHARFSLRPLKGGLLRWAKVRLPAVDPKIQPDGTVRMEVFNVSQIESEEYMPPESMINSRVHFFYVVGAYSAFWEEYGKMRAQSAEKMIERTKFLERAAQEIAPASDPPETRLRKLYSRVEQIRYLSYEPSMTQKEVEREHLADNKSAEDVLRHGYAYANEINFLFTALARAAGFDASIVQVVDRRSGIFEQQVYDSSQLNAMVVLIILEGKNLYFDPASRFCPYGELPWFENQTSGVRWSKLGGSRIEVDAPSVQSDMVERKADLILQTDGSLKGTLNIAFTGQEALDLRVLGMGEDEAGRRTLVQDEIKEWLPPGTTIDLDSIEGWESSGEPLRVKCHLHASHFSVSTKQRILFPAGVFQVNRKIPVTHMNRTLPLYFRHGYKELDKVTITVPSGYRVEALPAEATTDREFASFNVKRTNRADAVSLEREAELKRFAFPNSYYSSLWQYFQQVRKIDSESVVLHVAETEAR